MPKKTRDVFSYLKLCARDMRTVTYGEVAIKLAMGKGQAVRHALRYIRDDVCVPRHLPWLNAIVVNRQTRYPGDSFLPASVQFDDTNKRLLWRGVVLQVFSFDWEGIEIE